MAYVAFKDCTIRGVNVIDAWLGQHPDDVRAEFYSLLSQYENIPLEDWRTYRRSRRGYKKLTGQLYGVLREFYVDIERRYRLAAFRGPGTGEMTLLSGWIHDSEQAQQAGLELALERRDLVLRGVAGRIEHV